VAGSLGNLSRSLAGLSNQFQQSFNEQDFEEQKEQARQAEALVAATNAKSEKEFLEQNSDKPWLAGFSPFIRAEIDARSGAAAALEAQAEMERLFDNGDFPNPETVIDAYDARFADFALANQDRPERVARFNEFLTPARDNMTLRATQFLGEQTVAQGTAELSNMFRSGVSAAIEANEFDALPSILAEAIETGSVVAPGNTLGDENALIDVINGELASEETYQFTDEVVDVLLESNIIKDPENITRLKIMKANAFEREESDDDDRRRVAREEREDRTRRYRLQLAGFFADEANLGKPIPEDIRQIGVGVEGAANIQKLERLHAQQVADGVGTFVPAQLMDDYNRALVSGNRVEAKRLLDEMPFISSEVRSAFNSTFRDDSPLFNPAARSQQARIAGFDDERGLNPAEIDDRLRHFNANYLTLHAKDPGIDPNIIAGTAFDMTEQTFRERDAAVAAAADRFNPRQLNREPANTLEQGMLISHLEEQLETQTEALASAEITAGAAREVLDPVQRIQRARRGERGPADVQRELSREALDQFTRLEATVAEMRKRLARERRRLKTMQVREDFQTDPEGALKRQLWQTTSDEVVDELRP
jgi:hypothetical protein